MLKRYLAIVLAAALLLSISGAAVAGKKKKGPKPYTSEVVSIAVGHPALHSQSGTLVTVTAQEFLNRCAIPASNGFDAYVLEVPKEYTTIQAVATTTGVANPDTPAGFDFDLYFFDEACKEVGFSNAAGTDETGIMVSGTAYIVIHNYTGGPADTSITLKPY
jgi:hypothetical protein